SQDGQELESLRREVDRVIPTQQLTARFVQGEVAEMGRHGELLGRFALESSISSGRMFIICFPKSIGKRFPRTSPESFHPPVKIVAVREATFAHGRLLCEQGNRFSDQY